MSKKNFVLLCVIGLLAGCGGPSYRSETGTVYGTIYHITYESTDDYALDIRREMERVNQSLSMFNPRSVVARWNRGETEVVVSYADIVYPAEHARALCAQGGSHPVALTYDTQWEALWRIRFADPLLDAESFACRDGLLCDIGRKPCGLDDIHGQYMGLLRLTAQGWQTISAVCRELGEAVDRTDMTTFLRLLLSRRIPVAAVPVAGRWCEVDDQDDLHAYESRLAQGGWEHDWR